MEARGRESTGDLDRWVAQASTPTPTSCGRESSPQDLAAANARILELWKNAEPVYVLLAGSVARPRGAAVTYQLALCKQEEAERRQARLDLLARAGLAAPPAEAAAARTAWKSALHWWVRYAEEYPSSSAHAAARQLQARATEMLGDAAGAAALLEDLSGNLTALEKVSQRYQARRLKALKK